MPSLEVVLGTYERYLVGYTLFKDTVKKKCRFKRTFAEEAHNGSIKSVAVSDQFLVSGGTDECIRIYDLSSRRDIGTLMQQEGTITCLSFIDDNFLISGSDDGTLCVWDVRNWTVAKTLRGHKQGVCSLSVHPSGGLALSISKDKTIRTWDLVKGRCAFINNKKEVGNKILWSPKGKHFIIAFDRRIDVYSIDLAAPIHAIPFTKQIYATTFLNVSLHCLVLIISSKCVFFQDRILVTGLDDGSLQLLNVLKNKVIKTEKIHDTRIKDINICKKGIITASSDGVVKLLRGKNLAPVAIADCGARINCMTTFISSRSRKTTEKT